MLDPLVIPAAEAERNLAVDVASDCRNALLDVVVGQIEASREIAAPDVKAYSANGNVLLVGHDATDRLRVAIVPVRAQHALVGRADRHAGPQLLHGLLIML